MTKTTKAEEIKVMIEKIFNAGKLQRVLRDVVDNQEEFVDLEE
jgi:hypothetical protein